MDILYCESVGFRFNFRFQIQFVPHNKQDRKKTRLNIVICMSHFKILSTDSTEQQKVKTTLFVQRNHSNECYCL